LRAIGGRRLGGRLTAVGRIQARLLVHVLQVLAGVDTAATRSKIRRWQAAVGFGWPPAHAFIMRWISLLHSEAPTRSKYAS
jgi:hypothetical protein